MSKTQAFKLHPDDNVVVAGGVLEAAQAVEGSDVLPTTRIPGGHKMALKSITAGESILKFGQIIGQATCDISPGEHVHEHNLSMSDHGDDYAYSVDSHETKLVAEAQRETFQGYRRGDGKVGTRNYVGILTSVNCSAIL